MRIQAGQHVRLALGESAVLEFQLTDALGVAVSPSTATATIDGVALPASSVAVDGTVVKVTVSPQVLGVHQLQVTIDDAVLVVDVEYAAAHYFSLDELRVYGQNGQTDDFSSYPAEALFWARQAATETFERNAGVCYVQRKATKLVPIMSSRMVTLEPATVEASAKDDDGDAVAIAMLTDRQAILRGWWHGGVTVTYVHGRIMAEPVKRAVLKLAANYLRPLNRPEQATGESSDYGYITYTLAGRDGATGIPEVDAVIKQFGVVWPVVW